MNKVDSAVQELIEVMDEEGVDPRNGLPLHLFEFATTLLPFINVDLLIRNRKDQILLSWRSDNHYGTGWQIPGGIIRMMESIDERIQKTAIREIGCKVTYEKEPVLVGENIIRQYRRGLQNQLERAHNIALLYNCEVPEDYTINNEGKKETQEGFLRWFDRFPDDLLDCHKQLRYVETLKKWF